MLAAGLAVASALASAPLRAKEPSALPADVVAVLGRMQKTLAANQFSFRADTLRAYVGSNGELLHIEHSNKVVVRRPDHLAVNVTGDDGATRMVYDGKALTLYGEQHKEYAVVPVKGTIADMLDVAMDRMDIDFPLADLLTATPQWSLLSEITSGGQVGVATIGGVPCKHFYFIQVPDQDMELWVEDNDKALPRRVVITYRSVPGRPRFVAALSDWNFSIQPADAEFAFQPPADAKKVELKAAGAGSPPAK